MPREKHQEGWVEEVGKRVKKWRGHYYVYDAEGKRRHRNLVLGLKSKLKKWEAEEKLRAEIEMVTGQMATLDGTCTLKWFWEHRYLPTRTWGGATKSANTSVIERHLLNKFGAVEMAAINKFDLQMHLNSLAEAYSRSVVKKVRVQLGAMFEEAIEQKIVREDPTRKLKTPRTRKPCDRFLDLQEYMALVAQMPTPRDVLIVRMATSLGLRPGELFALRWNDSEQDQVRIDESVCRFEDSGLKEPKTEDSDAYMHLPPAIAAELQAWREFCEPVHPGGFIFPTVHGTPISAHNYERDVLVPAAIRAAIMPKPVEGEPYRRDKATAVNFQALRRTFATWMQKTGATVKDVQSAMRHSTPDQTIRTYMKEIPDSVRKAMNNLDSMLSTQAKGPVQ